MQVVRETFVWLSPKRSGVPPESVVLRERVRDTVLTLVGSSISDGEKEATAVAASSRIEKGRRIAKEKEGKKTVADIEKKGKKKGR